MRRLDQNARDRAAAEGAGSTTSPAAARDPRDEHELPPAHGGQRAVAIYLNRLEEMITTATPHQLAQLGYGLARILDARGRAAAPVQEGFAVAEQMDEAVANATPEQMDRLHRAVRDIIGDMVDRDPPPRAKRPTRAAL